MIELVVVLAIIGILLALAVPQYLGARRGAFIREGYNVLEELKTTAWAYYQENDSWSGLTSANYLTGFGMNVPPDSGSCWDFDLVAPATDSQIQFQATGDSTPVKCGAVNGYVMTLTLNSDGSSAKSP